MKRQLSNVFQFKVSLQDTEPTVWRSIQVPGNYSFWDLHVAIQDAMGWLDYHLHEFEIDNPTTGHRDHIGIPDDEWISDVPSLPGWETPIAAYFAPENPSALYTYDFGDSWQHVITLEQVLPPDPKLTYPRCLAGERACPPEDCGGVFGYEEFLQAIRDPGHEEHEEWLEWAGGFFDPEHFRPEEVEFDDPAARWRTAFEES